MSLESFIPLVIQLISEAEHLTNLPDGKSKKEYVLLQLSTKLPNYELYRPIISSVIDELILLSNNGTISIFAIKAEKAAISLCQSLFSCFKTRET